MKQRGIVNPETTKSVPFFMGSKEFPGHKRAAVRVTTEAYGALTMMAARHNLCRSQILRGFCLEIVGEKWIERWKDNSTLHISDELTRIAESEGRTVGKMVSKKIIEWY